MLLFSVNIEGQINANRCESDTHSTSMPSVLALDSKSMVTFVFAA